MQTLERLHFFFSDLPLQRYEGQPHYRNMLSKCLGVVLRKSSNKAFINDHLSLMFSNVNHANQTEREGCARGFGFTAYSHLDIVLEKLVLIAKTDMVSKSTGFLGMMKDKSSTDIARIKATLMLCYGFVTLYAKASLITSRVEVNILGTINPHFKNVRETHVKENLIRCVDLIGKSLHPSHLKNDKFVLHRRGDFLEHMLNYMKAESKEKVTTEIRALSMDACTTLLTLEPKLADAELFNVVDAACEAALTLNAPTDDDGVELMKQVLKSLKRLLSTILRKDTTPACMHSILKHLGKWLNAESAHRRSWMIEVYRDMLENYFEWVVPSAQFFVTVWWRFLTLIMHLGTWLSYLKREQMQGPWKDLGRSSESWCLVALTQKRTCGNTHSVACNGFFGSTCATEDISMNRII